MPCSLKGEGGGGYGGGAFCNGMRGYAPQECELVPALGEPWVQTGGGGMEQRAGDAWRVALALHTSDGLFEAVSGTECCQLANSRWVGLLQCKH